VHGRIIGLRRRAEPRKQVLLTQLDDFDAPRPGVDPGPGIATHESHGRAEVLAKEFGTSAAGTGPALVCILYL